MNRAERRQHKLGRTPTVIAMPTVNKKPRIRKVTKAIRSCQSFVTIDNGNPSDSPFVVKLMQDHFVKTGSPPITLDPSSPMLIARHKITNEPLAFLSCKPIPPGKFYIENFACAPGRAGRMAGRALFERLWELSVKKVCIVEPSNEAMLGILEHYGCRVVALVLEGPYLGSAPEVSVAAEPMEKSVYG